MDVKDININMVQSFSEFKDINGEWHYVITMANGAKIRVSKDTYDSVKDAVENNKNISLQPVDTLPSIGKERVIYFLKNTSSSSSNLYTEYMWFNNSWEIIGSSSISFKAGNGISISDDGTISVTFANGDDLTYGTSSN